MHGSITTPQRNLLDPDTAASYLGIAPSSLKNTRWRQLRGIPFYRLGYRLVRFERSELDAWLAQRRVSREAS